MFPLNTALIILSPLRNIDTQNDMNMFVILKESIRYNK